MCNTGNKKTYDDEQFINSLKNHDKSKMVSYEKTVKAKKLF